MIAALCVALTGLGLKSRFCDRRKAYATVKNDGFVQAVCLYTGVRSVVLLMRASCAQNMLHNELQLASCLSIVFECLCRCDDSS